MGGNIQKCDDPRIPVDKLHGLICDILQDDFGGCAWYHRAVAIDNHINEETGGKIVYLVPEFG